ncbi:hypothetical protein R6Q59_003007 [Mikania micrantha]
MKNNDIYPTQGEMYINTCTCKEGSIVDNEFSHVVDSFKDTVNDSSNKPGDPNDITNDGNSKVKGSEKGGYV